MAPDVASHVAKHVCTMQEGTLQAVVRSHAAESTLQIALVLGGKPRFMQRPKGEALEKTLARIQKTAAQAPGMQCCLQVLQQHVSPPM